MPFTDKGVAALKPKAARYEVKEPGRTGLGLRVTPKGAKTWTFVYRFEDAQRRMVLGSYPVMGLASARVALAAAREKLQLGTDPGAEVAEQRQAERSAPTIAELVDEYLERHARRTMRPITAAEDERLLRRDVVPAWGKRRAKDIGRRDIILLLDGIEERGAPVLRNRVAGLLSRLFMFALDRGVVDASPAIGIRRLEETARDRYLSKDEIRSFWHGLDAIDATASVKTALRFLLMTGQRRGEVAGAFRAEIDDVEALWHLPAARAKNGRDNLVPLPPMAVELIAAADAARVRPAPARPNRKDRPPYDPTPSPYLFPSTRLGKPLEPAALTRAVNRNRKLLGIGDATVHDLRRTFATWHGEIGTPPEILSALLNHTPATITAKVYDLSTNLEPRRQAMTTWCAWLQRLVDGEAIAENVVQLRASR